MSIIKNVITFGSPRHMVNGVGVTSFDFGSTTVDYDSSTNRRVRRFVSKPATKEVLEKYKITEQEYQAVCRDLVLSFSD
jgi:hypothetical protein